MSAIRLLPLVSVLLAGGTLGCRRMVLPPAHGARALPPPSPPPAMEQPAGREALARPVLLVRASSSAPNAQERQYAASVTGRLADWLKEAGLPVRVEDDEAVSRGAWRDASVVVLGYNPMPDAAQRSALVRFMERGGKLIVFYSADARLAAAMGLRLGPYATPSAPGCWSAFRFTSDAPPGLPARVDQQSLNLRPAFPDSPDSQVIAWWETDTGRALRDPAWVRSRRGYWMSHVLLEGDSASKKQLLVALLGSCDSSLIQAAAAHAVRTAGTLGRFTDFSQAVTRLSTAAEPGQQQGRTGALLTQAEQLHDDMRRSFRRDDFRRTLDMARLLDEAMTEVYARTQNPLSNEFRGVWNHSGTGLYPGDWDRTCRLLAEDGMTAVFPHVRRPWNAHYRTSLLPASTTLQRYGDQLQACVEAARRHSLEVHAWVICWNLEGAPESLLASYRKQGRLQVSAEGASLPWLCPSHPANLAFEIELIADMATRYPLDGVHLDYIRYKSQDYCFCNGCRKRFEKETGIRVRRWPADVRTGGSVTAWRQWRRDQITRLVVQTRLRLHEVAPRVKLSAAVYTGYPGCRDSIGQDWGEWLRLGHLDFACPMNYTEDAAKFAGWYRKQASFPGTAGRLYPGIGVTATESRLTAIDTLAQIGVLREEGSRGFMLFEANRTLEKDILPYLKMGATSRR